MALRGIELALRLHHGHLGVVGQLLRERALLHQFDAAFVDLLRGFEGLLRGLQIGLGFGPVVDRGGGGRLLVSLPAPDRAAFAFADGRGEIAAFEFR